MPGNRPIRFSIYTALATALVFTIIFPQMAKASPSPVTVNFSGSSICEVPSPFSGLCFGAETVTGSFEFDPATDSVIGSWAFSFSIGFTLSAFQGDQAIVSEFRPGVLNFFFTDGADFIDLDYAEPIAPGALALDGSLQLCGAGPQDCSTGNFVSGIVPEPSSFSLLALGGVGFLGLAVFGRRFREIRSA